MNIGSIFNKVSNAIEQKKEENRIYQELLSKSSRFQLNVTIPETNIPSNEGRITYILDICPNLNESQAIIIDKLIPIEETILDCLYLTQRIDMKNYIMVFTNLFVYILDKEQYSKFNYSQVTIFDIISKSLMTQIVNFCGVILGIDTSSNHTLDIQKLVIDVSYRQQVIIEKTKYLCGIIPIYQKINKIQTGISVDTENRVVFHDRKINNYIYRYQDIKNYELLEDQTVVLKKKTIESSHSMTSVKQNCTTMTLRVTLTSDQVFSITILEPTAFNSQYSHMDSTYMKQYQFAKEIIDKLDSMAPRLY